MRRLYPFFPTVLKENVQNSMNGLEKYFPFRRDMGCLAITARHVVGNKTTCKDFRTKTKLEQDRARSIRDFLTCWDRESKAISMDLETVCGPCCVLCALEQRLVGSQTDVADSIWLWAVLHLSPPPIPI